LNEVEDKSLRGFERVLISVLEDGQRLGLVGPGAVSAHLQHARLFAEVLLACAEENRLDDNAAGGVSAPGGKFASRILDLGSGGGIPGLVLAMLFPSSRILLLDARSKSAGFLARAVRRCGLEEQVEVLNERAESAGRDSTLRERLDVVVARSFGPPAVVAECGSPLVRVGGLLVVSEPPVTRTAGEASLSMSGGASGDSRGDEVPRSAVLSPRTRPSTRRAETARWPRAEVEALGLVSRDLLSRGRKFEVLRKIRSCPERFPRRIGVPSKRPLWK
jgi:16S rRNA (guanine527-N7)-methyltransferase